MDKYKFKPSEIHVQEWSSLRSCPWNLSPLSGVKLIHIPTGKVVCCDGFRSQHKNRNEAFKILNEYLINL